MKVVRARYPGDHEDYRTGRSQCQKMQDPEKLSDLAFKNTEDPYVLQIPESDDRSTRRLKVQDPEAV